ncbi:LAETG motif-containing sortase-dependent surface protein [Streptomyces sp. NPDC087300]|uniref:LAETG motif-containing sortase-dependent surface protein n=1 Tax=Streptomyces sp. NPDC087300 TaxID=3365780 RepID=UPI00380D669A
MWFVPSANATSPASHGIPRERPAATATAHQETDAYTAADESARLAETGGFDTTPYVIGGTAFLGLGAGFVAFSVRRERSDGTAY